MAPAGSRLYKGCCYGDGGGSFQWQGDRIIANFGKAASTRVLFSDPVPSWAQFNGSEFHKGVLFTLDTQF